MIVDEVAGQDAMEVSLSENEHVIQALAPDRTDEPFRERVVPQVVCGAVRTSSILMLLAPIGERAVERCCALAGASPAWGIVGAPQ
jgi:hypothetical protein